MPEFDAFLSYARDDFAVEMEEFLEELTEEIRIRLPRPKGAPILFRDTQNIDLGKRWRLEVINALQSVKVLLSMHTPLYFTRPYCGKEVGIVLGRQSRMPSDPNRLAEIIPINWQPSSSIPAIVRQYQLAHDSLPKVYSTHGLRTLKRNNQYRSEYLVSLEFLGSYIAKAISQTPMLPPLDASPIFEEAPDAFQDGMQDQLSPGAQVPLQGPRSARFSYVVAARAQLKDSKMDSSRYDEERGEYWRPFTNADYVGVLASKVASDNHFVSGLLPVDDTLLREIDRARDKNSLVILIVDTWTIGKVEFFRRQMEDCDRRPSTHCAVLVVWNEDDDETEQSREVLKNGVVVTFPILSTREQTYFRASITTAEEFESALGDTLRRLQAKVIEYGEVKRSLRSLPWKRMPILVHDGSE